MIKKCIPNIVYLACLFVVLVAPPTLKAQSYTLSNGEVLTYNTTGPQLAQGSGDNASGGSFNGSTYASGEAGGEGGVVNLLTSGYNAVSMSGGGGNGDHGWLAVLPITPAQRASNTPLFTQVLTVMDRDVEWATGSTRTWQGTAYTGIFYEPLTWTPPVGRGFGPPPPTYIRVGFAAVAANSNIATLSSNAGSFYAWFTSGQSGSTPGAPFTVIGTPNAILIWSGGQLHLTDGSSDTIIATPAGWAGDVAIVNMVEQSPNSSDGWNDYVYYRTASIGSPQPPSGIISASTAQVQTRGKVNITWQLQ